MAKLQDIFEKFIESYQYPKNKYAYTRIIKHINEMIKDKNSIWK